MSSHSHPDHTALNWKLAGRPLYAPEYADDTFGDLDKLGERLMEPGELVHVWREYVTRELRFETALPTNTYSDGHVFDFGAISLVAIHTPDHTIDHMCLFEPNHGILFSFDIDLTSFGPWYAHRESDIGAYEASIRKVMDLKPRIVVSSHKGIITDDIPSRLQRFFDVFEARDRMVMTLLSQVDTFDELVGRSPIYQGYPNASLLFRYWESQMVRKHFARLIDAGMASDEWLERMAL